MTEGDYVIITFGHNDEKNGGMDGYALYDYYVSKGDQTAAAAVDKRGTVPSTTYKENLGKIVDEAIALGAHPVICSPVCRLFHRQQDPTEWTPRLRRLVQHTDI